MSRDLPDTDDLEIPKDTLPGIDMKVEQNKDEEIVQIKIMLERDNPQKSLLKKYLLHEEILYISQTQMKLLFLD